MTATSTEVLSIVKNILKATSKSANALGVSEVLFLTVLKDQAELSIKRLTAPYSECDI